MDNAVYTKKELFLTILTLLTIFSIIVILLALTSFIWIPLLIFASPLLIILALLIKFTPVGDPFKEAYVKTYDWFFYKSDRPRKFLWVLVYNTMCLLYPQTQWKSMNYGYSVLSGNGSLIQNLSSEDEDERFCLQLYHYVVTQFGSIKSLNGLRILEVGSGRGGGLNYISKYLNPSECIGVDYSENQIRFCSKQYQSNKKLKFYYGDSEHLNIITGIQPNSFDIVLNVESSHCYGNFDAFIKQVNRALKPGGFLCFTDFRSAKEVEDLKTYFESLPFFTIIKYEDITINVIQSLKQDGKRRTNLIERNVSQFLKPIFKSFSGLQGSRINQEFIDRKTLYVAYILQKKLN